MDVENKQLIIEIKLTEDFLEIGIELKMKMKFGCAPMRV